MTSDETLHRLHLLTAAHNTHRDGRVWPSWCAAHSEGLRCCIDHLLEDDAAQFAAHINDITPKS